MRRSAFCGLAALFLVFLNLTVTPVRAQEFRALWLDAWHAGFMNASEVSTLVSRCNAYNYNAVIVQMRRRGDAFYMPQAPNLEPRTTVIASSYDALAELIAKCHAANPRIEVHCWVPTHLIWSDSVAMPTQPGHVLNAHPEYLMKSSTGATFIGEGYFLDPGNPDACLWNYNMAIDIVSRYDIDGFHWDYIRYPQQDSGYNDTALSRYNAEFGLSGQPSPSDGQWSDWRRRQVTDFLRWTDADLLAIKPSLIISTAVFASRSDAYTYRFQDWKAWNTEGIIDLCIPMNYTATNSIFNPRVDDAAANQGIRYAYMGPGAYLNTKENTLAQLNYSRNSGLLGSVMYSYAVPNSGTVDQAGTFSYIKANYQPSYEPPPTLPWKVNPSKGIIRGTVTNQSTGAAIYNASVTVSPSGRTAKTEPHGKYAYFEVDPGTYTVQATANGLGVGSQTVSVTAGAVATADVAVPAGDTTPPAISNVTAGSVTASAATITWSTNEAANSVVEYGVTAAYGSTASDVNMVTNHSLALSGLAASTTYYYRVRSRDGANNESVSGNNTFTTLAPGQVADIIVDNPAAAMTGAWTLGTSAADKYGADYRYKSQGTASAYMQYTPSIITAGLYDIYEWHCQGTNRSTGAPYVITYNGGSQTVYVNEQTAGGAWNKLGTYNLAAGSAANVKITDGFADAGAVAIADAIKFVYAGAAPQPPAAPGSLTAAAISRTQIDLRWADSSSNETNFVVEYKKSTSATWTVAATLAANTTAYSKTGLTRNTKYDFRVKATNAAGSSAYSNTSSATTLR